MGNKSGVAGRKTTDPAKVQQDSEINQERPIWGRNQDAATVCSKTAMAARKEISADGGGYFLIERRAKNNTEDVSLFARPASATV